jgi:DNA repair exonuclease SbcCD ATPase subunit
VNSNDYLQKLNKAIAKRDIYQEKVQTSTKVLAELKEKALDIEEAQTVLQLIAKQTQENIRYKLEDIVNLSLSTVFGSRYRFEIKFEIKREQTEASLVLFDGVNEIDPIESNGGGINDVLSFALRIALLIISKNRRILILDEPMKFISADLREFCYELMAKLSHDLGIQIICVTHEEELKSKADLVYKVGQKEGKAWVRSL